MDMEDLLGPMAAHIMENSSKTIFREKEYITGPIKESMMDLG